MIILDRTDDPSIPDLGTTLELVLDAAPTTELPWVTSAVELDDVNRELTPFTEHGVSTGTTAVIILAAPSDTELTRQLKALSIKNPAGNAVVTATVRYSDDVTTRNIITVRLEADDTLQYNDGEGFRVIDANGNLKFVDSAVAGSTPVDDQTDPSAATLTDAYTVPAGFTFEFHLTIANRSGTPTNFRWSIAIGGAADANAQYKAYDTPITGNNIYTSEVYKINAGDVIRVYATLATLSFGISGILKPI